MTKNEFKKIVETLIFPFFTGLSFLEEDLPVPKHAREKLATTCKDKGDAFLRLMPNKDVNYTVTIQRSQKFDKSEIELIRNLLEYAKDFKLYEVEYKKELMDFVHNKSVAKILSNTIPSESILKIINIFTSLTQETYEGHHISYAVAISGKSNVDQEISFEHIIKEDFGKILTNSIDSLLYLDCNCNLMSHGDMDDIKNSDLKDCYYPLRFKRFANLSKEQQLLVFVLTRDGEILIFQKGSLIFSKRRGKWTYYIHNILIKQMGRIRDKDLKKSVYSTILDASFSKGGACIALVRDLTGIYDKKNFVGNDPNSPFKSKCCHRLILGAEGALKFNELSRILRLELVSMDGAVILKSDGTVIAVGAIINIKDGNNSEGGRTAASKGLAKRGIAIKVSNDGYIRAFKKHKEGIKESFRIG